MFIVELNLSCQQSASPQYHSFPVCPSIQLSPLPPQLKTMGALALPSFCSLIGMRGREKLMSQFREGNYCCIVAAGSLSTPHCSGAASWPRLCVGERGGRSHFSAAPGRRRTHFVSYLVRNGGPLKALDIRDLDSGYFYFSAVC